MKFQSSIVIQESISKVYHYTVDPNNMNRWMHGFEQYKAKSGRRRKEGSTAIQVFDDNGHKTEVNEEVLVNKTNQEFRCRLFHKNMESEVAYLFRNQGEATKLIVQTHVRLKPFLFNLFSLFVKGPMRKQQDKDLKKLKEVIEGE